MLFARRVLARAVHARFLLVLPLVLVVAACTAGPSQRPAVAYRDGGAEQPPAPQVPGPAPVPPLGAPQSQALSWHDCTDATQRRLGDDSGSAMRFRCTDLATTLNPPEAPGFGQTHLSLLAAGHGKVPLVVVNDAGGEPGSVYAARLASRLPPRMLDTFQIIGMDRRGSGHSDPTACIPPRQRDHIVGFDPQAHGRPALDGLLDTMRSATQECLLNLDDRLPAYDTWRTASDLENLRTELGVPKLHAIGHGEGSRVLSTYAVRYPTKVGRMVFDGAPHPQRDAVATEAASARSAEETFDAFAGRCTARGCPLGPDPRRTVTDLVQRARATPLPGGVTGGDIVHAVLLGLNDPQRWPELATALAAAEHGDPSGVAELARPLKVGGPDDPARLDSRLITTCNDTNARVPPERIARINDDWLAKNPLFGGVFAQHLAWCSQWPAPSHTPPVPHVPGLPPMPVISTATDPRTPADGSRSMADVLPNGVPVRWEGSGHGALGHSRCSTTVATHYLVDGRPPQPGTVCPP